MLNEDSQHAFTSAKEIVDLRRPLWWTPMKALVKKSYGFSDDIMSARTLDIWWATVDVDVHFI